LISESELADWLGKFLPTPALKVVILDSCFSGGFWDDGLKAVPNTLLMTSADAQSPSFRDGQTGRALYTSGLIDGLLPAVQDGEIAKADTDKDGLSFKELHQYAAAHMASFVGQNLPVSDVSIPEGIMTFKAVTAQFFGDDQTVGSTGSAVTLQNPPVADAGPDQIVSAGGSQKATVLLNGTASFDPDADPIVSYQWSGDFGTATGSKPTVMLGAGNHTITLTVKDSAGTTGSDTVDVLVKATGPTVPPPSAGITVTPNVLWPPNHQMVPVVVGVSTGNSGSLSTCKISKVESNEAQSGMGKGDLSPDWQITGDLTLMLRAERFGQGSGRVYTITVECAGTSGSSTTQTVTVTVPHDQGHGQSFSNHEPKGKRNAHTTRGSEDSGMDKGQGGHEDNNEGDNDSQSNNNSQGIINGDGEKKVMAWA